MAKDPRIDELTDSLLAEQKARAQAAKQAKEQVKQEAAQTAAAEAAAFEQAFSSLSELAADLLEHHPDEAELLSVERTVPAGLFGNKLKTTIEPVPAWEVARGSGTIRKHFGDGHLDLDHEFRVMVAADGRIFLSDKTIYSAGKSHLDFRELPARNMHREDNWQIREILGHCGFATAGQITSRAAAVAAGTWRRRRHI
jgi:pterin-4a-carbinolamine dehydratase